jgi:hypothetical protein
MDEDKRALLIAVVSGNYQISEDESKLVSEYLFQTRGIIQTDLNYGNNRAIYEKGLELKDKMDSEFNTTCNQLNI